MPVRLMAEYDDVMGRKWVLPPWHKNYITVVGPVRVAQGWAKAPDTPYEFGATAHPSIRDAAKEAIADYAIEVQNNAS